MAVERAASNSTWPGLAYWRTTLNRCPRVCQVLVADRADSSNRKPTTPYGNGLAFPRELPAISPELAGSNRFPPPDHRRDCEPRRGRRAIARARRNALPELTKAWPKSARSSTSSGGQRVSGRESRRLDMKDHRRAQSPLRIWSSDFYLVQPTLLRLYWALERGPNVDQTEYCRRHRNGGFVVTLSSELGRKRALANSIGAVAPAEHCSLLTPAKLSC